MFLAHSFRLRDPWACDCLLDGAARWSRVFHRPTGLEPDDALWLVCSGLPPGVGVSLNDQRLSEYATGVPPLSPAERPAPYQFDVTHLLAETNRIELTVPSDLRPPASGLSPSSPFPYDVRLGIVGHS